MNIRSAPWLLTLLALSVGACTADDGTATDTDTGTVDSDHSGVETDTDTDTGGDTGTDTGGDTGDTGTDTDPPPRNTAQRCDHGGYLDAWFPFALERMQVFEDDRVREYPMDDLDPENHPGWLIHERLQVESRMLGDQGLLLTHQKFAREDVRGADPEVAPESWGHTEVGTFTQEGDSLIIASSSYYWECERRIRPTDPRQPTQQMDFLCENAEGVQSTWWGILWIEGADVREECLAEHEPPELPTRWSLWERTDESGTAQFGLRKYDGADFTATLQDLALHKDGTAELATQQSEYDAELVRLSWPRRTSEELTWVAVDDGLQLTTESGVILDCSRDYDIGELGDAIRTFALSCEGTDGVHTWWVPVDMTWPWGWGTHDTPHGWWWE